MEANEEVVFADVAGEGFRLTPETKAQRIVSPIRCAAFLILGPIDQSLEDRARSDQGATNRRSR
jgi:hypothetical protein